MKRLVLSRHHHLIAICRRRLKYPQRIQQAQAAVLSGSTKAAPAALVLAAVRFMSTGSGRRGCVPQQRDGSFLRKALHSAPHVACTSLGDQARETQMVECMVLTAHIEFWSKTRCSRCTLNWGLGIEALSIQHTPLPRIRSCRVGVGTQGNAPLGCGHLRVVGNRCVGRGVQAHVHRQYSSVAARARAFCTHMHAHGTLLVCLIVPPPLASCHLIVPDALCRLSPAATRHTHAVPRHPLTAPPQV